METTDAEKALAYYRAAVEDRRPAYVPSRIRLQRRVCGDGPFRSTLAEPGVHACISNQWGAVSVTAANGGMLGVKPAEFDVVEWRDND